MLTKINRKVAAINSFKSQFEDTVKKLAAAKENEVQNRYGIMEGSTLRIVAIEAKDFAADFVPYAVVVVSDQSQATKTAKQAKVPLWNEEFTLY